MRGLRGTLFLTLVSCLGLGLLDSRAQAGTLLLTYDGKTALGSSVAGSLLDVGTSYSIQALFNDALVSSPIQGIGVYQVTSITTIIDGTSYECTDVSPYAVHIADPSYVASAGNYTVSLTGLGAAYAPVYQTATPAVSAIAVGPTAFSNYNGFAGNVLNLATNGGMVSLNFDTSIGVSARITAVPEPSSLALTAVASLCGLGFWVRRRAGK